MPGVRKTGFQMVRMQLFQCGFGFVWMNQGVVRLDEFIRVFVNDWLAADGRIRKIMFELMTDLVCTHFLIVVRTVPIRIYLWIWIDLWNISWQNFDLMYPSSLYIIIGIEIILRRIWNVHYEKKMRKWREKNKKQKNKWKKEDEVQFALCCYMLDDMRKQFIPPKFCKHTMPF